MIVNTLLDSFKSINHTGLVVVSFVKTVQHMPTI